MEQYSTAQIAAQVGVHPNTIRFYEQQGLLPPVPRKANGYRIYNGTHLRQLQLIRLAFRAEIQGANLRNEAAGIVKAAAAGQAGIAAGKALMYKQHLRAEMAKAQEAVALAGQLARGEIQSGTQPAFGRREAAAQIGVSIDVLRDWERNGLLCVPRKGNRRQYGINEMGRLKIIAILRNANYSQMAIRRMLTRLDGGEADLLSSINTPAPAEDIVSVADRYITSLEGALQDANGILALLTGPEAQA